MKLTTKLLKEMIYQEMAEMQAGPRIIAVYADGREEEISQQEADQMIAAGAPQQDDFQTGDVRIFVDEMGDSGFEDPMNDMADMSDEDMRMMGLRERKK